MAMVLLCRFIIFVVASCPEANKLEAFHAQVDVVIVLIKLRCRFSFGLVLRGQLRVYLLHDLLAQLCLGNGLLHGGGKCRWLGDGLVRGGND